MKPDTRTLFPAEPLRASLLQDLWHYQLTETCISELAIRSLAAKHQLSEIEVKGVATFYHFFHLKPSGKHCIYLNNSIISELQGFDEIKQAFEAETGAMLGSVDASGEFGFFDTPCIGLSDQEPAALIDFYPFTNLTPARVKSIIQQLRDGKAARDICDVPADNIRFLPAKQGSILFAPYQPGEVLKKMAQIQAEAIIDLLSKAGIRGRGGAFFQTAQKWDACRKQAVTPKFIICNADEGEPGTFKDRVLLNSQLGSMLEGMIIAGFTTGANYGIIYLRGEYRWMETHISETISAFRKQGLLGKNAGGIDGFDFDIRLEIGAGAYVCGEETALLESLEGKRGEPRTKWFFPTERGYLQQPTVVNNVETFCTVARLLQLGLSDYLKRGIQGSPGTKLISISGDCRLPGIYEIEWGMSVSQLLDLCGAEDPYIIQVSGPSGTTISIDEINRPLCMPGSGTPDGLACGGSVMIFNHKRDLLQILMNFSAFFKHESCGVCTPCRAGNFVIHRKLQHLALGDLEDLTELKKWALIMESASRCGLGKSAGNAIINTIDKFQDYFNKRLTAANPDGIRPFNMVAAIEDYEIFKPSAL